MWPKFYRDYKIDEPLIKNQVSPSRGITGCEMHDLNGWGTDIHLSKVETKRSLFATLLLELFSKFSKDKSYGK
jgi:uncharacterized protein (UPF0128 family)